jgi:hypothetical protein
MIGKPIPAVRGKVLALAAGFFALTWTVSSASAQSSPGPVFAGGAAETKATPAGGIVEGTPVEDSAVTPAGCASCGGGTNYGELGIPAGVVGGGCGSCGSGGCGSCGCYSGCKGCGACNFGDNCFGRCIGGIYECLCCPDPCYEPTWIPVANSAFFVDAARPVTQTRWRYDAGLDYTNLDRSEFLMPRFMVAPNALSMGGQVGPANPGAPANVPGKGPAFIAGRANIENLSLYTEGAIANFSVFLEMFYNEFSPSTASNSPTFATPSSGFGDLTIGTKSLLLDCELMNLAFQFKTFIPTGNFTKGLGTGHVSLEPSLLGTFKLTQDCYFQWQTSYWIPIAGDQLYESNIWHSHGSFNKVLCKPSTKCQLIGTFEMNEWTVFQGAYTGTNFLIAGIAPPAVSATTGIFSAGPGIRLIICNYLDIGVGSAFALTGDRWAQQLIRSEFRWRF